MKGSLRSIGPTVKVMTKSNSGPISALSLQYKPRNLWQNNVYGSIADSCSGDSNIYDSVVKKRDHNAYLESILGTLFDTNESLMNSSLWHEDFTDTYDGRYFIMRLNPHTRITPDYLVDQIFLHLNKKLDFKIFLYHQDYFVLNSNLLRSILTLRRVASSMGNHYYHFAMTERIELDHPDDPCYKGTAFTFH